MATVTQWTPFGVALNITATPSTITRKSATQYTVKINVSWRTYWDGAETNYGMTASSGGASASINKFGTYASSGSNTITGTYSISGNGSATKTITVTFKNFNSDNGDSATKAVKFDVTVPAWPSYTVKYNANGGSPTPSNQTKWKDQTLTLSSTTPTRTGYSFLGWATSSTATSATYSAGGKYTANAAATLYAVWKPNTYTITYNVNGGSGTIASQTKTYGKDLILRTETPTLPNHTFKGWATSKSATTAQYQAGGRYTVNAHATLYAVWELAYKPPEIDKVVVERDSTYTTKKGEITEITTDAQASFSWNTFFAVSSITIKWKLASSTSYATSDSVTVTANGKSGAVNQIIGKKTVIDENGEEKTVGAFAADKTYDIRIEVADSNGSSVVVRTLSGSNYFIDLKPPANADEVGGASFGKPAELDGVADFGYKVKASNGFINIPLPEAADLDTITQPNTYCGSKISACINRPEDAAGTHSFTLTVESAGTAGQLKQTLVTCSEAEIKEYTRFYYSSAWHAWAQTFSYAGNLLWNGAETMPSGSIPLAQPISKQPHGIVLVFCRYVNGVAETHNYNSFFVPKMLISKHAGAGSAFNMNTVDYTYICTKYLYINDTTIGGNANNEATGTRNGITYNNAAYALRYVIGV